MTVEIATTVLVAASACAPANPYDLTDLATARDELGIPSNDTSHDTFLRRAITQASTAIANYCNRVFVVEVVEDRVLLQRDAYPYQVPGGVEPLLLSRYPILSPVSVPFTGTTNGSIVINGVPSTRGLKAGMLVFAADGSLPVGTRIDTVAGHSLVLTQAATKSAAGVPFTTGMQVIQSLGVGSARELAYGTDFTADANRGWLHRLDSWQGNSVRWEAQSLTVRYQAGYERIPADLVDACLRLITARFRAKGRDPMLVERTQSQALGSERFWVGATPGQSGALPPEIASLVEQYRVPVTA